MSNNDIFPFIITSSKIFETLNTDHYSDSQEFCTAAYKLKSG